MSVDGRHERRCGTCAASAKCSCRKSLQKRARDEEKPSRPRPVQWIRKGGNWLASCREVSAAGKIVPSETVKANVTPSQNIVGSFLAVINYEVFDMGVMVSVEKFLESREARESGTSSA